MVILPQKNEKDLRDIPEEIRKQMKLVLVESMDQVLEHALRRKPQPLKAARRRSSTAPRSTSKPAAPPRCPAGVPAGRAAARRRGAATSSAAEVGTGPGRCRPVGPVRPARSDRWSTATTTPPWVSRATASQADIKKAFRKLARAAPSGRQQGRAEAEPRFKEVNEANDVLADPEKRKLYDQLGADWEAYQRAGH